MLHTDQEKQCKFAQIGWCITVTRPKIATVFHDGPDYCSVHARDIFILGNKNNTNLDCSLHKMV